MAKKQTTLAALVADSQPLIKVVDLGEHSVTIQEMSGRQRFELAEREESNRWDTMLWICMCSMIDPKPADEAEVEQLKPEWVVKIATEAMSLSGIDEETEDEAEKGLAAVSASGGS